MQPLHPARPRLSLVFDPSRNAMVGHVPLCEDGHHTAIGRSKREENGIVRAECRYCGCSLMRMAASRRWFRCGEMGG